MTDSTHLMEILERSWDKENPLSWELWGEGFARASCLTHLGKTVAADLVTTFAEFFGDSCIQEPKHIFWSNAGAGYCPFNDSAHVMRRLFDLYLHIRLLTSSREVQRIKFFRNNIARNKDSASWRHMILQLELIGFALRDGAACKLEPISPISGNPCDLLITTSDAELWIEAFSMQVDDKSSATDLYCDEIQGFIFMLHAKFGLEIKGKLFKMMSEEDTQHHLYRLHKTAERLSRYGGFKSVRSPGWHLTMKRIDDPSVPSVRGIPHKVDGWARLESRIRRKAKQTSGINVWLRFDDVSGLFQLTNWGQMSLYYKLKTLVTAINAVLQNYTHIHGVIFSDYQNVSVTHNVDASRYKNGIGMKVPTTYGWSRETFIIQTNSVQSQGESLMFQSWYENEASWAEWASVQLGLPPMSDLIVFR